MALKDPADRPIRRPTCPGCSPAWQRLGELAVEHGHVDARQLQSAIRS